MSTHGDYIENVLSEEYTSIRVFKDDEGSKTELFQHNKTDNKLVKITSKNMNDHVFRILRGFRHTNLPTILDVCACEDHIYVLEAYVEGETLESVLKKGILPHNVAIGYMLDICAALVFLHSQQIIHRDIKPSNVIITPEGKAVLIDFSAARLISSDKPVDTDNLGTVGYAAPEQYGVYQSLPPTDIYALGVMFNEMVAGIHPSVQTPDGKLGRIIRKCTDTQISSRYQTVGDLAHDLQKYKKYH